MNISLVNLANNTATLVLNIKNFQNYSTYLVFHETSRVSCSRLDSSRFFSSWARQDNDFWVETRTRIDDSRSCLKREKTSFLGQDLFSFRDIRNYNHNFYTHCVFFKKQSFILKFKFIENMYRFQNSSTHLYIHL